MSGIEIKLTGVKEAVAKLNSKAFLPQARQVISKNGAMLADKTQSNMSRVYKGHWEGKKFVKPTGATRRSVTNKLSGNGLTATVSAGTKYFPYLELGTRKMSKRPTLTPAFHSQLPQFKEDVRGLLKKWQ